MCAWHGGTQAQMQAGQAEKRRKGYRAGGRYPYGYVGRRTTQGVKLMPDPKTHHVVRMIVGMRRANFSYRAIGKALDFAGHKPWRGKVWHPCTVKRVYEREVAGQ